MTPFSRSGTQGETGTGHMDTAMGRVASAAAHAAWKWLGHSVQDVMQQEHGFR